MAALDRTALACRAVACSFVATGLVSRIAPFFDQGGRLLQQFPTEDGYLMLTIARNLGIGNGMSIADGTIPTNGTQPLTSLLWAAVFWLVDGDKSGGVAGVLVLEALISIAAGWTLYALACRLLEGRPHGREIAMIAAAAWFASAQTTRHSMNGLETGAYALVVVGFAWALLRLADGAPERPALARWAVLGSILGVAFWIRIDAVLLCGVVGVAHLAGWLAVWRTPAFRDRFAELASAATVCAVIASPWLIFNYVRFGSIMPVSGQSEGYSVVFGQELSLVSAKLAEYSSVILQIPMAYEVRPLTIFVTTVTLLMLAVLAARGLRRADAPARSIAVFATGAGLTLIGWYGLLFGAGHFMSRYLFPISPFLAILSVFAFFHYVTNARMRGVVAALALLAVVSLQVRLYLGGDSHQHFQVVRWIENHVPDEVWVGAVQTGTIGFFHDRTINLDGKVNPAAMDARRARRIPVYVAESDIQFLADWVGIASWVHKPPLDQHFDVVVEDRSRNLAVLARRGAPRKKERSPQLSAEPSAI